MAKSTISWQLRGKPDDRILLRHIAKHFGCVLGPERDGATNTVQGDVDDLVKVRAVFNHLRTTALLRQAIVVQHYLGHWGVSQSHVETEFMKAFVNRCCEYLSPERERPFNYDTQYRVAGFNLADEIFKESAWEQKMTLETSSI